MGDTNEITAGVLRDLQAFLHERYKGVVCLWLELGVTEEMAQERLNKAVNHVRNIVEDMVAEETEMRDRILTTIRECMHEVHLLRKQLRLPELELDGDLTPLAKEEFLREHVEELSRIRVERFRRLRKLQTEERVLCKKLDMAPHTVSSPEQVPAEEDLNEMLQHVRMLEKELERRTGQVSVLRGQVSEILRELGEMPEPGLRSDLVCEDMEELQLSLEMVKIAKDYLADLQHLKAQKTAERRELVEKLESYWDRLEVPQEHRCAILSEYPGLQPSDFRGLRAESARCEELKREKLSEFLEHTKKELAVWFDKCGIPERKATLEAPSECNEATLRRLESELSQCKMFYEKHRGMFEKVARRELLWEKLKVFEAKMHDPDRFKNRGGALLQEERERKKLLKDLPKLEDEIKAYMEVEEHAKDPLFKMWANGFNTHMGLQHEERRQGKENEKERARNKQQTPLNTKGVKRPGSVTPLKGSTAKVSRLVVATPSSLAPRRNSPRLPLSTLKKSVLRRSRERARRGAKPTPMGTSTRQATLRTPQPSTSAASDPLASATLTSYNEFTAALVQPATVAPMNSTFLTQQRREGRTQQHETPGN